MTVSKVQYYDRLEFDKYLAMPGVSYSGLKGGSIPETDTMRFGTKVHNYLLEPGKITVGDEKAKRVAASLKASLGTLVKLMKPELSVTANFEYEGFILPWKGRIDLGIPNRMVIDLKVTKLNIIKAIDHFRYDRQITGYCMALNCNMGFIVAVHPDTCAIQTERIRFDKQFWKENILRFGKPIQENS